VLPDASDDRHRGLLVETRDGALGGSVAPTHWSFGQLCSLAATPSPASYFRESRLFAEIIADALNHNLRFARGVEEVKLLSTPNELRAINGPNYGRIWNADIVDVLVERFGDGVSGPWRVPGEFGNAVPVTQENTTLYASDRNMFVFLADEERRIEIPARRHGRTGSLARGFTEGGTKRAYYADCGAVVAVARRGAPFAHLLACLACARYGDAPGGNPCTALARR
jgi:hypothetical protein